LYIKYGIPQFAAYGCRILQQNSRTSKRHEFIFSTLEKYSKLYKRLGITNFTEGVMNSGYRHADKNRDIFKFNAVTSIENAAKIIKTVAKVICG